MASGYSRLQEERKVAGLCVDCGGTRGLGATGLRCDGCRVAYNARQYANRAARKAHFAAYKREWRKAKRLANIAALACVVCAKALARRIVEAGGKTCASCLKRRAAEGLVGACRRRLRSGFCWSRRADGAGVGTLRAGSAKVVRRFSVQLDTGAVAAVKHLKAQDLARRKVASKAGEAVDAVFQTARVVREAIGEFSETFRAAKIRDRGAVGKAGAGTIAAPFSFGADAATVAVIERHAAVRGGNLSWAVCDLLVAASFGGFAVRVGFGGEREARRERLARFDPNGEGG